MRKKLRRKKRDYYHKQLFVLTNHTFSVDILFAVNMTASEISSHAKRKGVLKDICGWIAENTKDWSDDLSSMETRGRMYPMPRGFLVCLKFKKDDFRNSIGNLVHEITHVVHYMLRQRRIPLNEDTEEIYTYAIEDLTKRSLWQLYEA